MIEKMAISEADLADPEQAAALVEMLDAYMRDPMEGGLAPSEQVKRRLVARVVDPTISSNLSHCARAAAAVACRQSATDNEDYPTTRIA